MQMKCPKCNWENKDDAVKCALCGADLAGESTTAISQPPVQTPQPPVYSQQPPPGPPQYFDPTAAPPRPVPDLMIWSIVITVLSVCCSIFALPFGIIAIVKSSQANGKKRMGDYQGAMADANLAKIMIFVAIGVWVINLIIGIAWVLTHGIGNYPFPMPGPTRRI